MLIKGRFSVVVFLLVLCLVCDATFMHLLMMRRPTAAACKPGCCQGKRCTVPRCRPQQKMKMGGGWCGCCPKCVTQLRMGATCRPKPKHPCPQMPTSECGCGLKCVRGKCCR